MWTHWWLGQGWSQLGNLHHIMMNKDDYSFHHLKKLEWRLQTVLKCMLLELELYRAHTPRAASTSCIYLHRDESCSSMHEPVDDLYLQYILLGCVRAWAESTWPACIMHWVGTVDRHGYGDQQKTLFVTLEDHIHWFEAYWSQFFANSLCLRVAQVPRSQDMTIFVLMTMTRPITLPLAAHGGSIRPWHGIGLGMSLRD
jgi:hypothetical protein